jgi:FkbM family methyltransferase
LKATGNYDRSFRKKLPNSCLIWVKPEEHIQRQVFWYGVYERNYVQTWQSFVEQQSIVVDIGANIGYYSLITALKAIGGRIYAFEPDPGNFERLTTNIALNKISNIIPVPLALSNEAGSRSLYISGKENRGMSSFHHPSQYFSGHIKSIKTFRLDQWWKLYGKGKISLVKMDIEGAELLALEGMKSILELYRPVVFVEISKPLLQQFGKMPSDIFDLFAPFQYSAFRIMQANLIKRISEPFEDELVIFLPPGYAIPQGVRQV